MSWDCLTFESLYFLKVHTSWDVVQIQREHPAAGSDSGSVRTCLPSLFSGADGPRCTAGQRWRENGRHRFLSQKLVLSQYLQVQTLNMSFRDSLFVFLTQHCQHWLDLLIKQHTSHLKDLSGSASLTEEETQYYYLLPSMWHEAKFIIVNLYMILWSKYGSVLLPHKKKTLTFITWELYCMNMINCTL